MRQRSCFGVMLVVVLFHSLAFCDFKYTQKTQVTGGSIVAMTKSLGAFSKNARSMTEPQISTTMLKGNRMRQNHPDGKVEIIDLEGKRFIRIDPEKKTYSTMTFDEFKASLQRAQERMKEEQAKAMAKHPDSANVKMVPKFSVEKTGQTRTVMNLPTNEVKMRMEMEMQSDDPKLKEHMGAASFVMTTDSWLAPDVPGYGEMREFYLRMAKELDWLPGMMSGMMNMNPQMGPAMEEFRKNAVKMEGMPLLQYVTLTMAGVGMAQAPTAGQPSQGQAPQAQAPTSAADAAKQQIAKSLGGMMGGFGHKKKQDPPAAPASDSASTPPASSTSPPASNSNAMMESTIEVQSFSHDGLDKGLFEVPAGYALVQQDPDEMLGGAKRH